MQTQLVKHGEGFAIVIEKPLLKRLGINTDTHIEITTDGAVMLLTPVGDPDSATAFRDALEKGNAKYAETLKKLAE